MLVVLPEAWPALWMCLEPTAQPTALRVRLGPPEQQVRLGLRAPTGLWGRLGWLEREILESLEQWAYWWQQRARRRRAQTLLRAWKCRALTVLRALTRRRAQMARQGIDDAAYRGKPSRAGRGECRWGRWRREA